MLQRTRYVSVIQVHRDSSSEPSAPRRKSWTSQRVVSHGIITQRASVPPKSWEPPKSGPVQDLQNDFVTDRTDEPEKVLSAFEKSQKTADEQQISARFDRGFSTDPESSPDQERPPSDFVDASYPQSAASATSAKPNINHSEQREQNHQFVQKSSNAGSGNNTKLSAPAKKNNMKTKEWLPKSVDDILQQLSEGDILNKIKEGGILYTRHFYLDTSSMKLLYTGSQKKFFKKPTEWSLSSIEEVREGEKDSAKRLDRHDRGCILVVVLGGTQKHDVLYLLCRNIDVRDKWLKGLRYALQLNQYLRQKESSNLWIKNAFEMADRNKDLRLDFDEVMKLLKTMNADLSKAYVKEMFNAADTNRIKGQKPTLDAAEFVAFFNMLNTRPEIEEIFLKYAKDTGYLTANDLQKFLLQEQKEEESVERCKEMMAVYEPQPALKKLERMSLIGFTSFLMSPPQHLFKRSHRRLYQDMTQPMTNYFINSSHNTYLAEDQLKGPSRVEMYRSALKRGCRCVELDCWNGSDGEPVIYHGYTFTSKILFSDVIQAIKDYAFVTSPYPVTLSLENHCDIEQQTVMANCMKRVFGDMLYMPDDMPEVPPSPQQLKEKIIVKGKKLARVPKQVATEEEADTGEVSEEDEAADVSKQDQTQPENHQPKKKSKLKLSVQFSNTVTMKSTHFHSTADTPPAPKFEVVSLAEKKIKTLMDTEPEGVSKYTRSMLVRTYPAGRRTDSSNYNPITMWCGGCQVVALNFQTGDEDMQILHGKFMDNGNSGYVLKPQCLMSDEKYKAVLGTAPSPTAKRLKIEVLSGSQLPKPGDSRKGEVIDPFLKIDVHGVVADQKQDKTSVIKNNGFNPKWNEMFVYDITVPELAIIRFSVYDYDATSDDFIGYFCVPVNSLSEGYRHFPVFGKNGDMFEQGVIFLKVEIDAITH